MVSSIDDLTNENLSVCSHPYLCHSLICLLNKLHTCFLVYTRLKILIIFSVIGEKRAKPSIVILDLKTTGLSKFYTNL